MTRLLALKYKVLHNVRDDARGAIENAPQPPWGNHFKCKDLPFGGRGKTPTNMTPAPTPRTVTINRAAASPPVGILWKAAA